jgi:CO dehydrogenase/acetyl-CoA synthase gamma subunit (corrinoid Fe-S protein)
VDVLFSARDICAERKPLLYPITRDNIEKCIPRIKEKPTPVGVRAASVEELVGLKILTAHRATSTTGYSYTRDPTIISKIEKLLNKRKTAE